ncbi:acyl-CoA Delta(11) desaturase-like isoform X3 [Leptidea sinapis]|uniref:acyl-CoA Delta(11) desaturase-like isoform X3 n=1 Tax=Leptidea sinapis TaxID=189913 RepID=UPI0021C27A6F|nr:acyl-CoA Delta(11) desaturase-like isoform X3 [Leptidea sinapis]
MPPNQSNGDFLEHSNEGLEKLVPGRITPRKYVIDYPHVALFGYGNAAACYGLYLAITKATWNTLFFNWFVFVLASIGVTAGAHRLWSHRAFKAKLPLQILLMVMQTLSFQRTVAHWVRDHRLHHRYSDTDADPHNASRGFFFSHIGWLLVKEHEEVEKRIKHVDMSDILSNPVLKFQYDYAEPFIIIVSLLPSTIIPVYFWGESLNVAWHLAVLRCTLNQHMTFLVNSAAHIWGNKPYDHSIKPAQNLTVSVASLGEGFHNYHHTFPWDYRAAELGNNCLNMTTLFIDFFKWIGWAYDLKTVDEDTIRNRAKRTGDGSDLWGLKEIVPKDSIMQTILE